MPFYRPNPDPIRQNILTGKISSEQPYIFYVCHLGQAAHYHGQGIDFAQALSDKIFGTKNGWFQKETLEEVCQSVGLELKQLEIESKKNEAKIIADIKRNQKDQLKAGHHGVPLIVYKNKYFFGQDQYDNFLTYFKENQN